MISLKKYGILLTELNYELKKYYDDNTNTLILPYKFNKELKNIIFDIEIINFEENTHTYSVFNHPVDHLPKNLKKLTFGQSFNQLVDNLPINLERLAFGHQALIGRYDKQL